ncbi:MAG: hypothetical protein M1823_003680, partial [Watsoniomyces obsoletus]
SPLQDQSTSRPWKPAHPSKPYEQRPAMYEKYSIEEWASHQTREAIRLALWPLGADAEQAWFECMQGKAEAELLERYLQKQSSPEEYERVGVMAAECLKGVRQQYAGVLQERRRAGRGQFPRPGSVDWKDLAAKKREGLQEFSKVVSSNLRQAGPGFLRSVSDVAWIPRMVRAIKTIPRPGYGMP